MNFVSPVVTKLGHSACWGGPDTNLDVRASLTGADIEAHDVFERGIGHKTQMMKMVGLL